MFKCSGMLIEGVPAFSGGVDEGARFASDKGLLNLDITCVFEPDQMGAEVAVRKIEYFTQIYEVDLLSRIKGDQRCHYSQPGRLVYDVIEL